MPHSHAVDGTDLLFSNTDGLFSETVRYSVTTGKSPV